MIIVLGLTADLKFQVRRATTQAAAEAWSETLPEDWAAHVADTTEPNWVDKVTGGNRPNAWLLEFYNLVTDGEPVVRFSDREAAFRRVGLRLIDRANATEPLTAEPMAVEPSTAEPMAVEPTTVEPATAAEPIKEKTEVAKTKTRNAEANGTGRRGKFKPEDVITHVKDNPKRAGSTAHKRYELYKPGMTVKQFVKACQEKLNEEERLPYSAVLYDEKHGNIKVRSAS